MIVTKTIVGRATNSLSYLAVKIFYSTDKGRLTEGGRLSTVDLLIKVACFVKK